MSIGSAAGKLFLAGEYAVVEPGRQALLVAVSRYAHVEVLDVRPASLGAMGQVQSAIYGDRQPTWRLVEDGISSDTLRPEQDVVLAVVALVDALLRARGVSRYVYALRVQSNLANADGRKYGLGSSAAVAVASLRALNKALELRLDEMALLKMGILASLAQNPNGSGGDVAASAMGGWLHYASPDRDWVRAQRQRRGLDALLDVTWPGLLARRLPEPAALQLLVGWTGSPANTPSLVAAQRQPVNDGLLDASDAAVMALAEAIEANDPQAAMQALRQARTAVSDIAAARGRDIETAQLRLLCEVAEAHGAAAKTSGAGGGDCGLALLPAGADAAPILARWQQNGIEPLPLQVANVDGLCIDPLTDSTARGARETVA